MRKALFIIILSVFSSFLMSQDIVVSTQVPSVVTAGEQFRITYTVNSKGGSLIAPEFKDFYKLMGPQTSYSQNTSIANGKTTSVIRNSFTYYLQATKDGEFTLEPAKFIHKNKEYLSRSVKITVVASGSESAANPNSGQDNNKAGSNVSGQDLYVKLLINRSKVILGEHIVATLKIYSRVNISGLQEVKLPDFKGFLRTDLETPPLRTLERENVGGKIYNTGVLQRFLLYPQKTGTIEIEPSTLTVLLQQEVKTNDPFFGDFFASYNTIPKVIATPQVNINVEPLPYGAPESFSGTVGSITMNSSADMDSMMVNDALTFRVVLRGEGNIKLSPAPELLLSPDIEVYEPKIIPALKTSTAGTSGTKTFEYILIPRHHGLFTIPEILYSYYDTDKEKYITLKTKEHKFYVKKGTDDSSDNQVYGAVTKGDITYLGKDIRYIRTETDNLKLKSDLIMSRSSFFIVYLSAFLIFIIIIIWRREHLRRNSDLVKVKNRKAARVATKRLKSVKSFLKESDRKEFYAELLRAIWGYLSDKLSIALSDINMEKVEAELVSSGITSDSIEQLRHIIETCEFSRYSPMGEQDLSAEIIMQSENLIKLIENEI